MLRYVIQYVSGLMDGTPLVGANYKMHNQSYVNASGAANSTRGFRVHHRVCLAVCAPSFLLFVVGTGYQR